MAGVGSDGFDVPPNQIHSRIPWPCELWQCRPGSLGFLSAELWNSLLPRLNHVAAGLVSPSLKSDTSSKEIEEAMKRVREAQSLISAAIEPGNASLEWAIPASLGLHTAPDPSCCSAEPSCCVCGEFLYLGFNHPAVDAPFPAEMGWNLSIDFPKIHWFEGCKTPRLSWGKFLLLPQIPRECGFPGLTTWCPADVSQGCFP